MSTYFNYEYIDQYFATLMFTMRRLGLIKNDPLGSGKFISEGDIYNMLVKYK